MRKSQVSVRFAKNLVASIDKITQERGGTRSETIREACIPYIVSSIEDPLDRHYVAGYLRVPEDDEVWRAEDWSDCYESGQ